MRKSPANRKLSLVLIVICAIALVFPAGCFARQQKGAGIPAESVTGIAFSSSPSFGDSTKLQRRVLSIESDGYMEKAILAMDASGSASNTDAEYTVVSSEVRKVDERVFSSLVDLALDDRFTRLPDMIETDTLDGNYQYLSVYTESDVVLSKGGLNAASEGPEAYRRLCDALASAWEGGEPVESAGASSLEGAGVPEQIEEYAIRTQYDEVAEMEAFRTLLPSGWSPYGRVTWDLASATAPARCDFLAVSPDGKAGFARVSDIHYVEQIYGGAYSSTGIASPDGTPLRIPATAVEMAYEVPGYVIDAIESMHVSGSIDADPEGLAYDAYCSAMRPGFEQLAASGVSVSDVFATFDLVTGTATIEGTECDFECYILMAGYTLTSPGSLVTITSNYWGPLNTMFYYAPKGRLGDYMNELDIISSNYMENANWVQVRNAVSEEAFRLLREKQLEDWARANEFSEALYGSMYYNRRSGTDYSSVWEDRQASSSFYHERWEETLTGREAWDIGGGEYIVADGFYNTMWGDGSGNFIGSSDPAFDPGAGWTEHSPLM